MWIWILISSKTCMFHRMVACGLENQCYFCGRGRNFSPFSSVHYMGSISRRGKITKLTTHPHTAMMKLDPCTYDTIVVSQWVSCFLRSVNLSACSSLKAVVHVFWDMMCQMISNYWHFGSTFSLFHIQSPNAQEAEILTNCQSTIHGIPEGLNHYCHHHHCENLEFCTVTVLLVFRGTSLYHHTRFWDSWVCF